MSNKTFLDRLGRNAGEVVGVFARVEVIPGNLFYRSSVSRSGLIILDYEAGKLTAPKWPTSILGAINQQAANRGKILYQKYCSNTTCHPALTGTNGMVHIAPYPLAKLGTDPTMTMSAHSRIVETGPLQGKLQFIVFGQKFGSTAFAAEVVQNEVAGALFDPHIVSLQSNPPGNGQQTPKPDAPVTATKTQVGQAYVPAPNLDLTKIGYEARPLNGIWAAAPYLHNGSVSSLYELLLPPSQRKKTFAVGSYEFDPINVGYRTDITEGTKMFDTSLPGNHNTGHEFGTKWSDAQRRDLIEYLKTL